MPETLAPPPSAPIVAAPIPTGGFESDAFKRLDSLFDEPKAKEAPKPDAPPKASKPAAKQPEPTKAKTAETPKDTLKDPPKVEAKIEAEKPAETKPVEGEKPKPTQWQLYRELEKKHKALEAEHAQLKTTAAPAKVDDAPEFKKLSEERDTLAKKNQELEEEVKYVNYERSSEYQDQYDKPYKLAVSDAISSISEFEVTNPDGTVRQANDADWWKIAQSKTAKEAAAIAEELFGNPTAAAMALMERKKVIDAYQKAERAKQEFRTKGTEREKQMHENRSKLAKAAREQWETLNKDAEKKYPDQFSKREGDEAYNLKLDKGFERVKPAFEGKGTPALESMIYMKAGAYDALRHDYVNVRAQLKDAEAKIAEYEGSEPGAGSPAKETVEAKELTPFEKIDRLGR